MTLPQLPQMKTGLVISVLVHTALLVWGLASSTAGVVKQLGELGAAYVDTPTAKATPDWHPHIVGAPTGSGDKSFADLAGAAAKAGTVTAWHVGGLIMLLELATAYAGQLYGIDAFNQPGVELGKQFAYALLGRPGSEAAKKEWDTLPRADARWIVG